MLAVATAGSGTKGAGSRIAKAATVLLGGFVASRLAGLVRDMVILAQFGTSGDLDLYYTAFRIPDIIFNLVAGGALGSAIVPIFAQYRAGGSPGALTRLASVLFNVIAVAAVLAAILGVIFTPVLVPFLGPGFDPAQQDRLAMLVRILLLQPIFLGVGEVLTRYLNVHQHFVYPALAPTLYNLGIIAGAIFLGPSFGTIGLSVGVVAGAIIYLLVQLPTAHARGFRWLPSLDVHEPGLRQIVPLMVPRLIDRGAVQLGFLMTTRLASFLPEGRFVALNVAWTLMMLPLGTFAMSAASAAFPTLADQAARGEREVMAATIRRTLSSILFLMVPAALGLIVVGMPLVQTLYERAEFTSQSSALTATALACFALGLPAHGGIEILTRSFYALQDTRTPVTLSVLAMCANVLLATILVGPLGHIGIALALSVSTTVEAFALLIVLRRRLPAVVTFTFLWSLSRTVIAALVMAAVSLVALGTTRILFHLPAPLQLVSAGASGAATYAAAAFLLRSPDLHDVLAVVRRKLGR
ncbi:MAG TPA: murein biosynthesis integral membrane protein MurJ [Chloroflexota bacterium]|nr:murein biosynthesis integral membrane protein MurJ [Chloroflexota bacterium]